ncbi:MAG UNVERIFIED_CONTAM: hypothetical protein LVT10_27485 [Anaerolineae bacterium]|jgi:glycerol kinase
MKKILALDQSTSSSKALLFETDGHLLDSVALAHQQIYPQPGWVEHDAQEIYLNSTAALQQLIHRNHLAASDLHRLSLTNQRETVVIFERATGLPLYGAMVWQCRRGDPLCQKLIQDGYEGMVRAKTGLKIDTYFPASKLTWLLHHEPSIRQKLERGEALIGTIDAYLIYRFTHGATFATDHSNASRTLLFNITTLQWDSELCDSFRVPLHALPEIRESSAFYGELHLDHALSSSIPICGCMGIHKRRCLPSGASRWGRQRLPSGRVRPCCRILGKAYAFRKTGCSRRWVGFIAGDPLYAFEGLINYSAGARVLPGCAIRLQY